MTDLLALVVLYRCRLDCSQSISSLASFVHSDVRLRVLIWDNSPEPCATQVELAHLSKVILGEVEYEHHPENTPLSRVYNRVINDRLRDNEYLLLLDQDTVLPQNFLAIFRDELGKHPTRDLFLPVVKSNGKIVSPARFFFGWGRYWKNPIFGLVGSSGLVAINSGMIIAGRYARGDFVGYDERLFFYGTDTDFMLKFARQRTDFVVLPVVLSHDLSFNSANPEERLNKFRAMRLAISVLFSMEGGMKRMLSALVMGAVSVVYAIRYRDVRYLCQGRS